MDTLWVQRYLVENLEESYDLSKLDDYEFEEYEWTHKRSRYRKGQKVMVLDPTGYHDSTLTIMDPRIIKNADGDEFLLASEAGGKFVSAHPLKRGKLEGEVKRESVEGFDEVSPPGFKATVKAMKKHKEIDNPYALAWYMKNKGAKSHYKMKGGKPVKKESLSFIERKPVR